MILGAPDIGGVPGYTIANSLGYDLQAEVDFIADAGSVQDLGHECQKMAPRGTYVAWGLTSSNTVSHVL